RCNVVSAHRRDEGKGTAHHPGGCTKGVAYIRAKSGWPRHSGANGVCIRCGDAVGTTHGSTLAGAFEPGQRGGGGSSETDEFRRTRAARKAASTVLRFCDRHIFRGAIDEARQ